MHRDSVAEVLKCTHYWKCPYCEHNNIMTERPKGDKVTCGCCYLEFKYAMKQTRIQVLKFKR